MPRRWRCTLFLLTVADAQGLSYYADGSIGRMLSLRPEQLATAREGLIHAELIAYEAPLYQVLALDPTSPAAPMAQDGRRARTPREARPCAACVRYCARPWEIGHDRLRDLLPDPRSSPTARD